MSKYCPKCWEEDVQGWFGNGFKRLAFGPGTNVILLKQVPDVGGGCNLGGINGCKLAMGANQLGRVPINCLIGKL